jgi:hypothetical protein
LMINHAEVRAELYDKQVILDIFKNIIINL